MIPPSARRAERILAISETTRRDIVDLLDLPQEKVTVTYLGVDLLRFKPERAAKAAEVLAHYAVRRPYLLYVGKLEPRKNLPTLIQAFDSAAMKFPDHQLVLAGGPGWGYKAIYETAAASQHGRRILFPGFVDEADLPILYAAADLFLYPSSYEGFGVPVVEAMASGVPVITSKLSSLPEVAGKAGLLVNPHDPTELAEAMAQVLSNSQLRQRMRVEGLEQARRFTWEKTARHTLQAYVEAVAGS
jgi:glycosyltransferase involved in cell wall biosynthesis